MLMICQKAKECREEDCDHKEPHEKDQHCMDHCLVGGMRQLKCREIKNVIVKKEKQVIDM